LQGWAKHVQKAFPWTVRQRDIFCWAVGAQQGQHLPLPCHLQAIVGHPWCGDQM